MADPIVRKLPPMTALEFAIASTFRHFFFGLWLAVLWVILLLPFMAAVYFTAFRSGMPDFKALPPAALAAFAALANLPESRVIHTSSLYRTAPVGLKNQPDFINAVAGVRR